jgi:hypothetical protein
MGVGLWIPMRLLDVWVFDTTRTLPLIGLTVVVGADWQYCLSKSDHPDAGGGAAGIYIGLWQAGPLANGAVRSNEVIEPTSQTEEVKPW